jgi:hypothetical protein
VYGVCICFYMVVICVCIIGMCMYQYALHVLYVLNVLHVYGRICTYCMYCMYCMYTYVSEWTACIACIACIACMCMYWDLHRVKYIHIHTIHAHTDICILGYTYALYVCVHIKFSNTCNITWHFQYIHICTGRFTDELYLRYHLRHRRSKPTILYRIRYRRISTISLVTDRFLTIIPYDVAYNIVDVSQISHTIFEGIRYGRHYTSS